MVTLGRTKTFVVASLLFILACKAPTTVKQLTPQEQQQATSLYKTAETQLRQGQVELAYQTFESVFTKYPNATAADNALLRAAQIKANQKQFTQAIEFLEQLVHTYPNSDIKNHAHRDQAYIYFMQKDCEKMMDAIFLMDLRAVSTKDQAKLSSRTQRCIQSNPNSNYKLVWDLKKYEQMKSNNPLYSQTQEKIIKNIESLEDEKFLTQITKKYENKFPAGFASFQLIQLSKKQENRRKVDKWSKYFQKNFPLHPKAEKVYELAETQDMDQKANGKKIGVLLPLSGPQKHIGQLVLNGLTLAVGTFNKSYQENAVELVIEDTASNPEKARQRMKKLIVTDKVISVIGPLTARETESVADLAASVGLPLITLSPKEDITKLADTVFRNSITKKEQAIALAQLTNEVLNIHRVAILYPETNYGREFMQIFWKEFEKYGGRIHGAESYEQKQTHFARPIKKLVGLYPSTLRRDELCSKRYSQIWLDKKKKGLALPNCYPLEELPPIIDFEAILIPDGHHRARQILPALKYHDVRGVQVLGTNLWNTRELLKGTTGGELEGALFLDSFYIGKKSANTQEFVQMFYTHYGYEPSVLEAQSYDSLRFLIEILSERNISSRSRLVQELYKKKNFNGVTGLSGFSKEREAIRNLTALMVSKNKIVELY